jgi:hypothetical protein
MNGFGFQIKEHHFQSFYAFENSSLPSKTKQTTP